MHTNITIYNIDNLPDFKSRYNTLNYKFKIGASDNLLTISVEEENCSTDKKKYSTDKLKAFLTAYGISFEI